ncbi:phosphatases II [Lophiostoma macrostomum CBS 122681]|uniref:protein-tyrosine-phosphatase n=1 Tax=Lophiostoma macrostomum CBS 122681 TaxID=1314788 RepID=A0A6A6TFZ5_9PLEO|nr:phosphatases II [Lophiostoma macrostomum CBS 122681]
MEVFNSDPISDIIPVPGLCISDITISRTVASLKERQVTHVVSLTSTRDCPRIPQETGIQHLHIEIDDNPMEDLLMHLDGICAWIRNALHSSPSKSTHDPTQGRTDSPGQTPKVLVHCLQGISRSGSIIVAYLMQEQSLDYDAALAIARISRSIIMPNSGFADQLRLWHQMGYSIYRDAEDSNEEEQEPKLEYEEWKANRGVLLSKGQEEKQKIMFKSMADMAARFGARRLELKRDDDV